MKSKRLKRISEFINPNDRLADIGCDHGYLGIYGLRRGISFLQLVDNKEGPLSSAKNNLKNVSSPTEIVFTLGDGLSKLDPTVNTIVLSGMGGELIISILEANLDKAKRMERIIIQPNTKILEVRKFLSENHFSIIDEDMVSEKGKIYEILVTNFQPKGAPLSDEDCYFGPILRKKLNPLFKKKYQERITQLEEVLSSNLDIKRYNDLQKELKMIKKEVNL